MRPRCTAFANRPRSRHFFHQRRTSLVSSEAKQSNQVAERSATVSRHDKSRSHCAKRWACCRVSLTGTVVVAARRHPFSTNLRSTENKAKVLWSHETTVLTLHSYSARKLQCCTTQHCAFWRRSVVDDDQSYQQRISIISLTGITRHYLIETTMANPRKVRILSWKEISVIITLQCFVKFLATTWKSIVQTILFEQKSIRGFPVKNIVSIQKPQHGRLLFAAIQQRNNRIFFS